MAGGAAGGFVVRAFESMLKECSNRKHIALQSAIQTYLESGKEFNQQSDVRETKPPSPPASNQSGASKSDSGAENVDAKSHLSIQAPSAVQEVDPASRPTNSRGSLPGILANAGHTLGDDEAELVLNPLRLAFETKNTKFVELALDCLHKLIEYNHLEGDPGLEGGKNSQVLTDILKIVCSCVDNSAADSTTLQVLKVLLSAIASTKMRVHGEPLLEIIRVCFSIALHSKSPISQAMSKAMLSQILRIIFRPVHSDVEIHLDAETNSMAEVSSSYNNDPTKTLDNILWVKQKRNTSTVSYEGIKKFMGGTDIKGLEAILEKAVNVEDRETGRGMGPESMTIENSDALLVFRTLCKMGMKVGNDDSTTRTRILALDFLQGLLEDVGCSCSKDTHFIDFARAHLSLALLRASSSKSPILFQHATGIFSDILLWFRGSFKAEIGVLFPVIVLRSLDGSDVNQKIVVLRMLEKVCKDPQMLVDLYINYDCDLESPNLFDKMVAILSKISQSTQNVDPKSSAASQASSIKTSSLQDLVNVLKALAIWEKSNRESNQWNNGRGSLDKVSHEELSESKSLEVSPENHENLKAHEFTIDDVISEFNQHPTKAVKQLISSQLVENNPASIAQFLRNTPNLNKVMIGDYLGQHEEFPVAVMHAYVKSINFSAKKFDVALLEFLEGFQLPSEALKIDRIFEKFAECYCVDNPGLFKNANTAYVLAYAVILLKADHRMSKDNFISINNTYTAEEPAPLELLEDIYGSTIQEQMKIKEEPAGILENGKQLPEVKVVSNLVNILNLSLGKRISSTDSKPASGTVTKQIQAQLKKQGEKRQVVFYTSNKVDLVCPMVEAVGWPLLAAFAVNIAEVDNMQRISICMEGFQEGICITHVLGMDTMRYAFLTSLLRYNSLHAPKGICGKNVEALRTLLALCETEMHTLEGSWLAVLESVSRLEYVVSSPTIIASVMEGTNQSSRDAIIQSLRELAGKPTEQVFLNSTKLPSESVVEFFLALCNISVEELKHNPARDYGLQKIVEASYYNMARVRMVWARIWSVLAQHFIFAGCHADEKIASYSTDSLRKLGMKYLEREELASFTFQNDIFKPFVVLMQSSKSEMLRKFILDIIVRMIKSKVGSVKSGWHGVFMVFTTAAKDDLESIVEQAFETAEQVILEHFDQIVGFCFTDCVKCLMGFSNNKQSYSISLKAIALLHLCADRLAEDHKQGDTPYNDVTGDRTCEEYWFPMLAGLSDLTSDRREEVRNCALEVLFDLLNERGRHFSPSFWENVFQRVLFPILNHVKHAGEESSVTSGEGWNRESCVQALQLLCNLFNAFYKEVSFMLSPLLDLLLDCAKKTDQSVVSISLNALVHLIEVGGHQFSDNDWDMLLKSIRGASYTTQPLEILNEMSFEAKHRKALSRDMNIIRTSVDQNDDNQQSERPVDAEGSAGVPSPSGRSVKATKGDGFQRNPSLGQKIMGNMFSRSFSSKPKTPDVLPTSPSKSPEATTDTEVKDEESPVLRSIRSKCITQLLLLCVIDGVQQKYWDKLNTQNKITVMEILYSVVEFSASYNSYANLRARMHQVSAERPPLNLLREELSGTCIYLEILLKTTTAVDGDEGGAVKDDEIERIAEGKLVSFCEQVLRQASDFQSTMEETADMDVYRVLELRSPITVKVLKEMRRMNPTIFSNHLKEFYPSLTNLVCCQHMDMRNALADLFSAQLGRLLQ